MFKTIFILLFGKIYKSKELPDGVTRFIGQNCFDMAELSALTHKLNYCDGIAKVRGGRWLYHAWLTDGKHAYDVTWGAEKDGKITHIPSELIAYIGIEMNPKAVSDFMIKTGYQGVLANAWRNPKLAWRAIMSTWSK